MADPRVNLAVLERAVTGPSEAGTNRAARLAAQAFAERESAVKQQQYAQSMAQQAALAMLEEQGRAAQRALTAQNLAQDMAQNLIRNDIERDKMALETKLSAANNFLRQQEFGLKAAEAQREIDFEGKLGTVTPTNIPGVSTIRTGRASVGTVTDPSKKPLTQLEEARLKEIDLRIQKNETKVNPLVAPLLREKAATIRNSIDNLGRPVEEVNAEIEAIYTPYINQTPKPTSGTPEIGEIRKGFRYLGGPPSQQSSWEKVE